VKRLPTQAPDPRPQWSLANVRGPRYRGRTQQESPSDDGLFPFDQDTPHACQLALAALDLAAQQRGYCQRKIFLFIKTSGSTSRPKLAQTRTIAHSRTANGTTLNAGPTTGM
jgi:hypothetical protein